MCLKTLWIPEYLSSIRTLKKNDPVPGVRAVCHEQLLGVICNGFIIEIALF